MNDKSEGCMPAYESFIKDSNLYVPKAALLEKLYTGTKWGEGPVYFMDTRVLIWSDIPNNRMLRWADGEVTLFRSPANNANGNFRDRQGRLVTCEHGSRAVTRTEYDGSITFLATEYKGKRLNSPNDLVVKSDGTLWFTDPTYGIQTDYQGHRSEQEQDGCYVFCLDPRSGRLEVVADDFVMPNGIAFSPDEKTLYISDTGRTDDIDGPPHIRAFQVSDDNTLRNGKRFADMRQTGSSDGFRLDTDGNIWTSAGDGVNCYSAEGELLLRIPVGEAVANLTFGGPKRNTLYITAHTSLYSIDTARTGVQWP